MGVTLMAQQEHGSMSVPTGTGWSAMAHCPHAASTMGRSAWKLAYTCR